MKYLLSTADLKAIEINNDDISTNTLEATIKALKKQEEAMEQQYRAGYDRCRAYNQLYSEKKISYTAYLDSGKNFNRLQDSISKWKNNLRNEISDLDG